mmetsp:Transcript_24777/g.44081  ORF Transcript_24777/g.44081 Transcript_24777/m.44081 type:complete len:81 (-) Transcript_24777:291-533(-)
MTTRHIQNKCLHLKSLLTRTCVFVLSFIKESMGPPAPGGDVEKLQAQVKEQAVLLEQKDKEIEELKQKLAALTEEQKKAE